MEWILLYHHLRFSIEREGAVVGDVDGLAVDVEQSVDESNLGMWWDFYVFAEFIAEETGKVILL